MSPHVLFSQGRRVLRQLVLIAAASAGLAQAESIREPRSLGAFQTIVSSGSFDVRVRQADRTTVEIEGEPAAVAQIETTVEPSADGPVLHLRTKPGVRWGARQPVRVHVGTPELRAVTLRGSGDLEIGALKTPELRLGLRGSGDARIRGLQTERLSASLAGSGDLEADGQATRVSVSMAGSGGARLRGLASRQVEVSIAGSGDAEVQADESLSVQIAGSGDVRYAGPARVSQSVLGSGRVSPLR